MRRLAIIDLETGDQPVANERGDVVAIVNGELYNYRELRAELEAKGHTFRGVGDVEVVPHLYEEHGERFVEHLRGMFAIALWDESQRAARARARPLRDQAALPRRRRGRARVRVGARAAARARRVVGARPRGDRGLPRARLRPRRRGRGSSARAKLGPGALLVHEDGRTREEQWWRPEPREHPLEETLAEAVRLHLRSDVPLAVLLSGGLDSSLIASLAAHELDLPLRTFTVGFADAALRRARAGARDRARDRVAARGADGRDGRRGGPAGDRRAARAAARRSPPRSRSGTSAAPSPPR